MISIYSANNNLLISLEVDDDSFYYSELKGEEYVQLTFSTNEYVAIPVGSYCVYNAIRFTLYQPHNITINNTKNYSYNITMHSAGRMLRIYKFRELVQAQTGEWGGSRRISFNLTAKPHEHLKMLVDNLNERDTAGGWTVGECIEDVEHLITYDNAFCWEALTSMAEEFGTEFSVIDKTISLCKQEYNKEAPIVLSYGKGNGLVSGVTRSNDGDSAEIGTLFVQGGERNITYATYGSKTLLLPKNGMIAYDGEHFDDETGFVDSKKKVFAVSDDRYSIKETSGKTGYEREESFDSSGVYPSHTCTISKVEVDANGCYCITLSNADRAVAPNFVSNRVPDSYETIIFQSGELAGREFQVNPMEDGMVLQIVPEDNDGETMPGGIFIPKVGDTFNVYNILLPDSYIQEAEREMFKSAVRYLYENGSQKVNIDCTVDKIWAKKNWTTVGGKFVIGGYVAFTDLAIQPTPLKMRILSIRCNINNPHSPTITISTGTITNRSIKDDIRKALATKILMGQYGEDIKKNFEQKMEEFNRVWDITFDDTFS